MDMNTDILIYQVLVPLLLLTWLALGRAASRSAWLLKLLAALGYFTAIAIAGLWLLLPWFVPHAFIALALALAWRAWRRTPPVWWMPEGWRGVLGTAISAALACAAVALAVVAASGLRAQPGTPVELQFPLRQGTYYTANGGSIALMNPHLLTLQSDPRFLPWRGQSYGVDIVALGPFGLRAAGLQPADPAAYAIFGHWLHAPCAGRVISTESDRPDMPVPTPDPDRSRLLGNHVLIACAGTDVEVALAHLQQGSVRVQAGMPIDVGEVLGRVGNSGNSFEPHLHISAQRRAPGQALLGGEPVPMLFGGRQLKRNDRLTVVAAEAAPGS